MPGHQKTFFRPFGPQFGLNISGGSPPPDPPLVPLSYLDVRNPGRKAGALVEALAFHQSDLKFVQSDTICGVGFVMDSLPCSERFNCNSLCGCLTSKSLRWVENLTLSNVSLVFQFKGFEGKDLTPKNLKLQSRINIHWTGFKILCYIKGF